MFFSKNKNKLLGLEAATGKEDVIASDELFEMEDEEVEKKVKSTEVTTSLSIHPEWHLSQQEHYIFQFHNEELSPLLPNQISISGIVLGQHEENLIVTAFVRNSLSKTISFNDVPLMLLDKDDKVIAKKTFTLDGLGEIPAASSRPWHFYFEPGDIKVADYSNEGWKLAFELSHDKHTLDLDESWKKELSDIQINKLTEIVDKLPVLPEGEVNFMGLEAKFKGNEGLYVTILIRNGSKKNIHLEQLPLVVEDATSQVVAKGSFKLDRFEVKANTTKPWTFIFPTSLVIINDPDLSTWKAYAPQN